MALACAVFAAALLRGAPAAADDAFFSLAPDLPVMQGLIDRPDRGLAFDKPDGRIVHLVADGTVPSARIHAFYRQVLPAFGWQASNRPGQFRRGDERLLLSVAIEGGRSIVSIAIQPMPKP